MSAFQGYPAKLVTGESVYVVNRNDNGRRKQSRQTGQVAGIEQSVKLNRGLWVLAQEMAKLKQN